MDVCNYCQRGTESLKRCAGCVAVFYCSRSCQSLDWPEHKLHCRKQTSYGTQQSRNVRRASDSSRSERNDKYSYCKDITTKAEEINTQNVEDSTFEIGRDNPSDENGTRSYEEMARKEHGNRSETGREETGQTLVKGIDKLFVDERNVQKVMEKEYHTVAEMDKTETNINTFGMENETLGSDCDKGSESGRVDKHCFAAGAKAEPDFDEIDDIDDVILPEEQQNNNLKNVTNGEDAASCQVNKCNRCRIPGCSQKCARCKETFYCSKACQKTDWPAHKQRCNRRFTEEEKRIIEEKQREKKEARVKLGLDRSEGNTSMSFIPFLQNHLGGSERFCRMLTPEQALVNETRPPGSLEKAVIFAKLSYPFYQVITRFRDMPMEPMFPFQMFMQSMEQPSVLVAFMFSYHEHVMRHGVYLKDAVDTETRVEFYLDHVGDNPFPFFSYSQVKPGNYILIEDPKWHLFMDGTVGIRINDPSDVCILDIQTLKNMSK